MMGLRLWPDDGGGRVLRPIHGGDGGLGLFGGSGRVLSLTDDPGPDLRPMWWYVCDERLG